ncbi:lysine acetyltransferase [Cladorrhinum sp. PSN259]|nr:lysine acetyltransferase [Cladorrhinum sp. PSN259]
MAEPMGLSTDDIVFGPASEEQRHVAVALRGEAWAPPMSLADYIERESFLSQQELTCDAQCILWVVYLKGYPRQVIASCETTRKPVLISAGDGSPPRDGHAYSISNVYTNPTYRRMGMAALLLRRVQEVIDKDSDFSVLYSDSGRNYYHSLGWPAFTSRQANLLLLPRPRTPTSPWAGVGPNSEPSSPASSSSSYSSSPSTNFMPSQPGLTLPLNQSNLPRLCEVDEMYFRACFASLTETRDHKIHAAFLPNRAQIDWQLARSGFDAEKLVGKTNPIKGAITTSGRAWITWAHDWREKRLRVLRISLALEGTSSEWQRVEDARALLEAALAEAREWGFSKVVVWNPDSEVTLGCKSVGNKHPDEVKVVFDEKIDGSLPSLRWREARLDRPRKRIEWEENQGFCLC